LLSYFRINDPYRLIGLLVAGLLLYLPLLIDAPPMTTYELKSILVGQKLNDGFPLYSGLIDSTAPLTGWVNQFIYFIFGTSIAARHIIAFILIMVQAVYLGIIFIDKKVFPESSFLPSLIFTVVFLFSFDNIQLSGELFASLFLLFALYNLLREIEFREESLSMVLKIGVFTGIASLFSLSYIVYIPGALVILLLFTRSSGRKFSLLVVGFLIPHLLLNSFYFIYSELDALWTFFYIPNLSFYSSGLVGISVFVHLLIVPCVFTLIAIVFLNRESRFTKYQSQLLQAFFFWVIFCFLQALYSKEFRPQSLISIVPPFAFFISHFLLILRRRTIAELAFWILIGGTVGLSYSNRYSALDKPVYETYIVKEPSYRNSRILVLSDDLFQYKENSMATPFLNWQLSRGVFEHPEYYGNVVEVYNGIKSDKPRYIIDPTNAFEPFLARIPEFRKAYKKTSDGYELTSAR
jgi:hypothetical protein